jgi:hypothetical protein
MKENENIYIKVSYDFSKFDEPRKSRCDVPSGTTQGWVYFKINF